MKKIILAILLLLVILIVVLFIKTVTYPFAKIPQSEAVIAPPTINDSVLHRLAGGIRIPTISNGDYSSFDYAPFDAFKAYIEKSYPYLKEHLETYYVGDYSFVFRLKGTDSNKLPILFLSHYDVVPPGSAKIKNEENNVFRPSDKPFEPVSKISEEWDFAPFSGAVANGRIYGRGTMDMKGMLFALLEALQNTATSGKAPQRDIYLAFGFDEEVGGEQGAAKVAAYFKEKGLRFEAIYDEGGFILEKGSVDGVDANVALVGCAEKGFLSLKIKVKGLGGHSSMPPAESAIGRAAIIMQRLEKDQMKPIVSPLLKEFFRNVGGFMPFTSRLAISNQWLMESVLLSQLQNNHSTNALIRTTTALTMMKGSDAPNVLSPQVEFVVNFRLLPENTIPQVKEHVQKATKGFDVEISEVDNSREASKVSPSDAKAYKIMETSITKLFPDLIVSPYLTVGGTDAIKYQDLSDHVYRFMPIKINNSEQQSMHSTNEYISIENYMKMIEYFEFIMKNYDS